MSDLIVVEEPQRGTPPALTSQSLLDYKPRDMVVAATEIANVLKDVIDKQELYKDLNGNRHVKAEGWSTLGTMLSILPKEREVKRHEDGSYEAFVDLINTKTGMIVGAGSGFVGMDETNWAKKPNYARRSMAITRATSKAYRTCFSWIISLAGYNPTPAEEMDGLTEEKPAPPKKTKAPKPAPVEEEPFKAGIVYDGSEAQKEALANLFDKLKVTDKETRSKVHHALIQWKCPFETETMKSGIITALEQIKKTGKTEEIPF